MSPVAIDLGLDRRFLFHLDDAPEELRTRDRKSRNHSTGEEEQGAGQSRAVQRLL